MLQTNLARTKLVNIYFLNNIRTVCLENNPSIGQYLKALFEDRILEINTLYIENNTYLKQPITKDR